LSTFAGGGRKSASLTSYLSAPHLALAPPSPRRGEGTRLKLRFCILSSLWGEGAEPSEAGEGTTGEPNA